MIRNELEYAKAVEQLKAEEKRLDQQTLELQKEGFTEEQIKHLTDPIRSFHLQLVEEVNGYEKPSKE